MPLASLWQLVPQKGKWYLACRQPSGVVAKRATRPMTKANLISGFVCRQSSSSNENLNLGEANEVKKSIFEMYTVELFQGTWWAQTCGSRGWQLMISGLQKGLISGWHPWYPAVKFGSNMAVFSDFSFFFFSLFDTDIWLIFRYIRKIFFHILLKSIRYIWLKFGQFSLIFVYYTSDIRLISLISWYPVCRFPGRCYPLGGCLGVLSNSFCEETKWS